MNPCRNLQAYLDGGLAAPEARAFEEHLSSCGSCRPRVEEWRDLSAALAGAARKRTMSGAVTVAEREALLARARAPRHAPAVRSRPVRLRVAIPAALAAAAAVAVVITGFPGSTGSPGSARPGPAEEAPAPRVIAATAPGGADVRIGPARVVLDPRTRIEVTEESAGGTGIGVARGRVAFGVDRLEPGAVFAVEVGPYAIRVTGTVFAVSREGTEVGVEVAEGSVEVSRGRDASWRLLEGWRLRAEAGGAPRIEELPAGDVAGMLALFRGPRTGPVGIEKAPDAGLETPRTGDGKAAAEGGKSAPGDDLDHLRRLAAGGSFVEAEGRLAAYLDAHPADTAAWSLLADCRRKSGRYSDAVAAYLELIDRAAGSEAGLARYKAGMILQDRLGDHVAAARMFEEFLRGSGGDALAPDALVRAARSHAALGDEARARELLERVVAGHPGHQAAAAAAQMLERLRPGAEGPAGEKRTEP